MSNNIIAFPKNNINQITNENVQDNVLELKMNHVNDTLEILIEMLFNNIEVAGFILNNTEEEALSNIKDGTLIVESIRSLLCKYYGIHHPFQDIAENVFEQNGTELTMLDKININFNNNNETGE